jgi:hypothetical protein
MLLNPPNHCKMVQNPVVSVSSVNKGTPTIALTAASKEPGQQPQPVSMPLSELIAYSSDGTHTRLNLTGRKVLHVKETTDQIDRLVRAAATQFFQDTWN